MLKEHEQIYGELNQKMQELTDYNERLYNECEGNISKKVELQEKLKAVIDEQKEK